MLRLERKELKDVSRVGLRVSFRGKDSVSIWSSLGFKLLLQRLQWVQSPFSAPFSLEMSSLNRTS